MTEQFTGHQATDPATDPELLGAMAATRPDLRSLVAANPATPPHVVEWLATLGDRGVDAALARRRPAPPAPGQPPQTFPPPAGPPVGAQPPPTGPTVVPANPWEQGGRRPPSADPYAPRPYGAPAPYGATVPSPGPAAPYGAAAPYPLPTGTPQDAYQYLLPEPGGRRVGLVVAVAVGAVLLLGALVFAASTILGAVGTGSTYGEDPNLDRLWEECADGDGQACDNLYMESPAGSGYEEFGDTCGERFPPQQVWCTEVM